MPCEFTDEGWTCGREAYHQQHDGEWRCIHHINVGYHLHNYDGRLIWEKPIDCGHFRHCAKCCCGQAKVQENS
jgi:hypothetical protein